MALEIGEDAVWQGRANFYRPSNLTIGKRCFVGEGTVFHVTAGITIGDDVLISWDCLLMDTDMHTLDWQGRADDVRTTRLGLVKDWTRVNCAPIVIEDKAWIGSRCIVLAGSHIGEGAVIGAGSVVRGHFLAWTVYAGNPARKVRSLR